jgi:hypothetical protein
MVSPLLHVGCCGREGRGRRHQGRTEAAQGKRKGREGAGHGGWLYRRNINIQCPRFNYSHVIHSTSESSMWISKRSRFNEIFTSAVSDRPSEQRFKKSNFRSTPEPLSNIFFVLQKWSWFTFHCEASLNLRVLDGIAVVNSGYSCKLLLSGK